MHSILRKFLVAKMLVDQNVIRAVPAEIQQMLLMAVRMYHCEIAGRMFELIMRAVCISEEHLQFLMRDLDLSVFFSTLRGLKENKFIGKKLQMRLNAKGAPYIMNHYFVNYKILTNKAIFKVFAVEIPVEVQPAHLLNDPTAQGDAERDENNNIIGLMDLESERINRNINDDQNGSSSSGSLPLPRLNRVIIDSVNMGAPLEREEQPLINLLIRNEDEEFEMDFSDTLSETDSIFDFQQQPGSSEDVQPGEANVAAPIENDGEMPATSGNEGRPERREYAGQAFQGEPLNSPSHSLLDAQSQSSSAGMPSHSFSSSSTGSSSHRSSRLRRADDGSIPIRILPRLSDAARQNIGNYLGPHFRSMLATSNIHYLQNIQYPVPLRAPMRYSLVSRQELQERYGANESSTDDLDFNPSLTREVTRTLLLQSRRSLRTDSSHEQEPSTRNTNGNADNADEGEVHPLAGEFETMLNSNQQYLISLRESCFAPELMDPPFIDLGPFGPNN